MSSISRNSNFFTAKHLASLGLFSAFCVVGRLSFSWLPNVSPTTTILLLICFYWGLSDALIVANLMVVATGLYLGLGYWIFEQMLTYSTILLIYYFLIKIDILKKLISQILIAFLFGILYGFIISLCEVFIFKINFFWAYYGAGISFDFMHAIGNFFFMLILMMPFEQLWRKFR